MCVIDGCEVCAYWSFRHRLLHQTNNSYHNTIIKSCCPLQKCPLYVYSQVAITKTKCVMASGGEVRDGSLEVVGEGGGGGGGSS